MQRIIGFELEFRIFRNSKNRDSSTRFPEENRFDKNNATCRFRPVARWLVKFNLTLKVRTYIFFSRKAAYPTGRVNGEDRAR